MELDHVEAIKQGVMAGWTCPGDRLQQERPRRSEGNVGWRCDEQRERAGGSGARRLVLGHAVRRPPDLDPRPQRVELGDFSDLDEPVGGLLEPARELQQLSRQSQPLLSIEQFRERARRRRRHLALAVAQCPLGPAEVGFSPWTRKPR